MRVRVVLEAVFQGLPDGRILTGTSFHAGFFARYLAIFSQVEVIARVEPAAVAAPGWRSVDGPGISVRALPAYRGLGGFLRQRHHVVAALRAAVTGDDALILRVPSPLAGCVDRELAAAGRPYAVEVVGDPWDVFAPGALRHPLRPLLRRYFRAQLRRQCAHASVGCYVTAAALQRRYPLAATAGSFSSSDVELGPDTFVAAPRAWSSAPRPAKLILVGSLAQLYKGPDILIRAMALCQAQGFPTHLEILGDGVHRDELVALAARLGVGEHVRFLGHVAAGPAVRERLDAADVFMMPSRTEGLPRALLEAMARGMPCLASAVGGIPELLAADDLVPPGDAAALARAMMARLGDVRWLGQAAARNLDKACDYRRELLDQRHAAFLTAARDANARWQAARAGRSTGA